MTTLFEKYLKNEDPFRLDEAFPSQEARQKIFSNPVYKKIDQIVGNLGGVYTTSPFYISGDLKSSAWLAGDITQYGVYASSGYPTISVDRKIKKGFKVPEIYINIPAVGNETVEEAKRRIEFTAKVIKAIEELKKLDWSKLEIIS